MENCLVTWKGMYVGHVREPTIVLEAIASYDLWIWHAFFGLPGSHNDINVLDRSFLFTELAKGRALPAKYSINVHDYTLSFEAVSIAIILSSSFICYNRNFSCSKATLSCP